MQEQNPIRPTDDQARALARDLIDGARFGALAVHDPQTGAPYVARVAVGQSPQGQLLTLVSDLSFHTRALRADPRCSVLVGEPKPKGDALAFPRLTVMATARFTERSAPERDALRDHYLQSHPKAKLYVDFADFHFVMFDVSGAHLNGGFGKAFVLTPQDLQL